MSHDWIGLRDDDLTERERALSEADEHREAHTSALSLGQSIAELSASETVTAPSADAALAALRARSAPSAPMPTPRSRWVWAAPVALAAAALFAVSTLPTEGTVRDKGATPPAAIHLEAAAEGPAGLRPLSDGASVSAQERVLFRVETDSDGWITLTNEAGEALLTARGQGRHVVGGDTPMAYRPDGDIAEGTYRATVCRSGPPDAAAGTLRADCSASELTLAWD